MFSSKVLLLVALSTCAIVYAKDNVMYHSAGDSPLLKLIGKIKTKQATIIESDLSEKDQTYIAIKVQDIFDLYDDDIFLFIALRNLMSGLFPDNIHHHFVVGYNAIDFETAYYITLIVNDQSLAIYGTKGCY